MEAVDSSVLSNLIDQLAQLSASLAQVIILLTAVELPLK